MTDDILHEPARNPSAQPPSRPSSTAQLAQWDRTFVWHPFTPMKPWCENKEIVVIERGEREFLIDTDGRRYIDAVSSLWCNIHGHNVPELNAAVEQQLSRVAHSTLLGLSNVPAIVLAKRLVELVQRGGLRLDKVFYSDNGSTAVEVACKMAFQFWRNEDGPAAAGRSRFIAFADAYHGDTIGAVSLGGIPVFHHAFKSLCFPVDFAPVPERGDQGAASLAFIENLLAPVPPHRPHPPHRQHAAIIIEPLIQGAGGMLVHPPGFLHKLRALADRHQVLLIADEVMTGFGRTGGGNMFACEHESVTPDLLCLSKGLTAGYMPLGVTMATQKVFDAFYADPSEGKTFFHGHTFTGHPLACAVAIASLDLFERNNLLSHVAALESTLADCLAAARKPETPGSTFVHDVRQCGLIGAIELRFPDGTPFPAHWRIGGELCTRMRALGLMMRPLADTLVIMPPLAITPENLRCVCHGALQSLAWIEEIIRSREATS